MKKSFKILLLSLLTMVFIVGCSKKEVSKTFTKETQPGVTSELTYKAKDDDVYEQIDKTVIDYKKTGNSEMTKETAKEGLKDVTEKLKNLKGVTYSEKFGDETATIEIKIDFDKADLKEIAKKIPNSGIDASKDYKKISLEKSEEMLKTSGYKEVNKKK